MVDQRVSTGQGFHPSCAKAIAAPSTQLMGSLPAERVTDACLFAHTGLNYAGPVYVTSACGRGHHVSKGYLLALIYLCTKAVHLELVEDLTTPTFLAALRRFIARRSLPKELWSDNATTFRSADAELQSLFRKANITWSLVQETLAFEGIQWKFITPADPYFGGLWEVAVKSAKGHIKRVLHGQLLTYEELNTFISQVEMCLNSWSLTPIIGKLDDLQILTPGHFLVLSSLLQLPMDFPIQAPGDCSHCRPVQALQDQFWLRWGCEYIHTL